MKPTRRAVGQILAAAALWPRPSRANESPQVPGQLVIPPPTAKMQTTACAYCIVACGYKAYTWPVGEMGGPAAADNAFGVDYPVPPMSGYWISPQMHNVVSVDGAQHHVVVMPDPQATVVNVGGNHSLGGSLATKLYNPDTATADRLQTPLLRVDGELVPISWDEAIDLMARVSRHILRERGPLAWGMKTYSYQFYENTYAITKLAFDAVGTPCWAPHDSPLEGSDTPGLKDAGLDAFSASYQDWKEAEVILVSGVSLYEAKAILFDDWVRAGGAKLIVVDPRRSPTAEYALSSGGMHLQLEPGTDALLYNSIAKVIIESGWADEDFIREWTALPEDIPERGASDWRRARYAMTFEDYAAWVTAEPMHDPEVAATLTGVSAQQIKDAARLMGEGRPRTSVMFEKGNYWALNYANTAAVSSLGLLVGAGNRPGRMISRGGGHQRGMIKGGSYPHEKSPERIGGFPAGLNLDRWALRGNLAFAWVIGNTWAAGGSADASALFQRLHDQARMTGPQLTASVMPAGLDVGLAAEVIRQRVDAGGLFFVQQDIYPQKLTELADLVLPAASWGEDRFSRMNGERRLRVYAKICDPPGQALSDWQIIQRFAQAMGYAGFDWRDTTDLFHEAGLRSGGAHDYKALIEFAEEKGAVAMDVAAEMGTTGIQCPIVRSGAELIGTVRLHESGFNTKSGRAFFVRGDFAEAEVLLDRLKPQGDELWVINRRASTVWSAMIEDLRNPFRMEQLPENPILMNPADASERGLSDGDLARVVRFDPDGEFQGTVAIADSVKPGVVCVYFNFIGDTRYAANNVTSALPDPVSGKFPVRLGRGRVERV